VDGMPQPVLFNGALVEVLAEACHGREDCSVRAYGEMVDLLWKDGSQKAAIRLEMLWNQLAQTREFSLLCGYSMGNFYKKAGIEDIFCQHSHILEGDTLPTAVN
jgi:hypothetical protein